MSQPEINIGTAGHVDHGKTTLLARITGKWADDHSEELRRGITIKLGYADAMISKCEKCKKLTTQKKCACGGKTKPIRKISFVDAPGHETLMATMLSGAATMDGAILLIAANEGVQEQTREHLHALEILGVKHVIIVQNKIDTVNKEEALKNYREIKKFVKGTVAENAPIIPISAEHGVNIDKLLETIQEHIPTPKRNVKEKPVMIIARSFDVNKPGTKIEKLTGGVVGGVVIKGELKVGDKIEIKPGIKDEKDYNSLKSTIKSISSGGEKTERAMPGGSVGIGLDLDMYATRSDRLAGNVLGHEGHLPPLHEELKLKIKILDKSEVKMNEPLMLTAWTAKTVGIVREIKKDEIKTALKLPVCIDHGERVAIAQRKEYRWTLIGYGEILE